MALINVSERYNSIEDIEKEVDNILGVDVSDIQRNKIKKLFRKYTYHIVIPEVIEMLKIIYEEDIKRIKSDIVSAKIAGADRDNGKKRK